MNNDRLPPAIGWGCLVAIILLAGLAGCLAIIFLWDVDGPHG